MMKTEKMGLIEEDNDYEILIKRLLKCQINLEYYDIIICSEEVYIKILNDEAVNFSSSGCMITLTNGIKRELLFLWESRLTPSTIPKMKKVLSSLTEDMLIYISRHSLKQTLKRIRKTNFDLN